MNWILLAIALTLFILALAIPSPRCLPVRNVALTHPASWT